MHEYFYFFFSCFDSLSYFLFSLHFPLFLLHHIVTSLLHHYILQKSLFSILYILFSFFSSLFTFFTSSQRHFVTESLYSPKSLFSIFYFLFSPNFQLIYKDMFAKLWSRLFHPTRPYSVVFSFSSRYLSLFLPPFLK